MSSSVVRDLRDTRYINSCGGSGMGLQGPKGDPGPQGPPGPAGAPGGLPGRDGQIRFTGQGPPPPVIAGAQPGDTYLDVESGIIYRLE